MAEAETALQMAARHVAEQEARVSEQEQLITRLLREGHPRIRPKTCWSKCAICWTICATTWSGCDRSRRVKRDCAPTARPSRPQAGRGA